MRRHHRLGSYGFPCSHPDVRYYHPSELHRFVSDSDVIYLRVFRGFERLWAALILALRKQHRPVIWEINAPLEEGRLMGEGSCRLFLMHAFRRATARFVNATVCNTASLSEYAQRRWRISRNHVVRLGSDPGLFFPDLRNTSARHTNSGTLSVCWIGSAAYPWQGLERVMRVAERLASEHRPVRFELLGKASAFERYRPLPNNVAVVDEKPYFDVPQFLADFDVGLCLYRRDSYDSEVITMPFYRSPLKLFDYMASGVVPIADDTPENRHVVNSGHNGILINDDERLAGALLEMQSNPHWRQSMAKQARQSVISYYNWERVACDIESIAAEVVGGNQFRSASQRTAAPAASYTVLRTDVKQR